MDSTRYDRPELPPELIALQEKALDFAIERGRADISDRRKILYLFIAMAGAAFVTLLVMLIKMLFGMTPPSAYVYVIGLLAAPTVTVAGCVLGVVAMSLSDAGRRGAGASLLVLGQSALGNIRRALGSGLGVRR